MPDQSGFIPVGQTRLFYSVAGSGPALLFIHAGVADSRMWQAQVAQLADQFTVVTCDLRGFGKTELVPEPFSHHGDIHTLLTTLGIASAAIAGCSMGGAIAINVALTWPSLVNALVLVDAAIEGYPFADPDTLRLWQEAEHEFLAGRLDLAAEIEVAMWVDGPQRTPDQVDPAIRELIREMVLRTYRNDGIAASERKLDPPPMTRLGSIAAPTLVITGELDRPDFHAIAALLSEQIPQVRPLTMPGCAHLPSLEQPTSFNNLLREFLRASRT